MTRVLFLTLRNDLRYVLRYPLAWAVPILSIAIFFLSILAVFPRGMQDAGLKANIFAGYMTLLLYLFMCQGTTSSLSGKAAQGLLEREFVSPLGHLGITTCGLLSELTVHVPFYLASGCLLAGLAFGKPLVVVSAVALLPVPMLFLAGLALALLGLDLLWKRTAVVFQPFQFVMMILAFASIPSDLPIWRWLPYTAFAKNLKTLLANGPWLSQVLDWRSLVVALTTMAAGVAIFRLCDRKAMREGTISHF